MAGPWEQYQKDSGPWDAYKGEGVSAAPVKIGKEAFADTLRQTLQDTPWLERNWASMGTAASNLHEGGKQLVKGSEIYNLLANGRMAKPWDGAGTNPQIEANRVIEKSAPVGSFVGNAALTAPMLAAGGPSIPAAVASGGVVGALQPTETEGGRLANATIGGALGGAGQAVANAFGQWFSKKAAELAAQKSKNAPIDATIKEALDAGYVLPPGQVKPTFINRQLESAGGKIATQQMASAKNQEVTDALARKAAGLLPDDPITPETLKAARDVIKKPYEEIAGLGLQPKLDALDAARAEANAAWREYGRQGTRSALNDFKQFSTDAKNIEREIESSLMKANRPELMKQFKDARVALAKNHNVESALIEGGGTVDARAIGRMFQRGDKMTGELATIGKFANNFKKDVQPGSSMGTPDAHNLRTMMSILMGSGGGAAMGPAGIALGAVPMVAGPVARSLMFSKPVQQGLLNNYSVGALPRATSGLLQYSPVGATALGVPAFAQ